LAPSDVPSEANGIRRLLADVEDLLEQMELSVREIDSSKFVILIKIFR
jgi:hypothetical protein